MTSLQTLLNIYRQAAETEREKGTYFEELFCLYLRNEPTYKDLYSEVWTYADWAREQKLVKKDAGIDLVAKTKGTDEFHAIQCKFYDENYRLKKADIDSFFTASGKKIFSHRIIVSTTNNWSDNAEDALINQNPPVTKIDLNDLENSVIDWSHYQPNQTPTIKDQKALYPHQITAVSAVENGLDIADRGKLIMACGTGKTFTSLKIAEKLAGKNKRVLFLVPSLSLLSQTLTEWTQESTTPLHSFAVCSDSDVGKKREKDDETVRLFTHELRYPATTNAKNLAHEMAKRHDVDSMSVVFSTYHSIEVIGDAQKEHELPDFDLIICDEAHRTTGANFGTPDDESAFVKVHNNDYIKGNKRLYMTATPRIFGEKANKTAEKKSAVLCSMDDESLFGKDLHIINFTDAVRLKLLVDYKVLVLAIDERTISKNLQKLLSASDNQLKVDDAAKIVGCWKALSKHGTNEDLSDDNQPMRRAVAFCQVIEVATKSKTHKISSKNIADMFEKVVEDYQANELKQNPDNTDVVTHLKCKADHVDGSMNASAKEKKLNWLKQEPAENTCHILSNVRCLSEGVDVPALDAVLFLTPRNSVIDVVQSVGRVMRNAKNKKRGYVILPVVIPAGIEPHRALDDNKTYKVVWQVLQALRSHDDSFDAFINKLDLIGKDVSKMEVIAITDKISKKSKSDGTGAGTSGKGGKVIGNPQPTPEPEQGEIEFEVDGLERALYAKVVQKCGNPNHWEEWANDISSIARTHIIRIQTILESPDNTEEVAAFEHFLTGLRAHLNPSISQADAIEMLAQHLITKPVFDALFEGYAFTQHNPVSLAMQAVLNQLQAHNLDKEADTLQRFYDSVKERAKGIDNAAGKQRIVIELYDKFFKNAFPRMTERLGIVYTPVEVVDFIIHSADDALRQEFGVGLTDENVHILDPFTGTGTFIVRLLQSQLIKSEDLARKYAHELHANEIVLLAYYIAAINIEAVYHDTHGGGDYSPFQGIVLTDTFQLEEPKKDLTHEYEKEKGLLENGERANRQKANDIRVIIGNPPYSGGQDDAGHDNKNLTYPSLDERIAFSYIKNSLKKDGKSKAYNSYIRAIRWASDRIKDKGMVCYVTDGGFIQKNTMDGLRKSLTNEFSRIYCFNLRGDQRTSGETSRQEGGKIFGSGSRASIAITLLIKNPEYQGLCELFYYDIGYYLSREEKLKIISDFKSISGISWQKLTPNDSHDWINHRNSEFESFLELGNKDDKTKETLFNTYSMGIKTNRDDWVFNFSKVQLVKIIKSMIDFYNKQVDDYAKLDERPKIEKFISTNPKSIKWTEDLIKDVVKLKKHDFEEKAIRQTMRRPFCKQWLYCNKSFNWTHHLMPKIFPDNNVHNLIIYITGTGITKDFNALMTNILPDFQLQANGQGFPLYTYEPAFDNSDNDHPSGQKPQADIFGDAIDDLFEVLAEQPKPRYTAKENITDAMWQDFKTRYDAKISKEDIFYYVYGVLHSPEYKERFASDLKKMLPRIPFVQDFWTFSQAGRDLAKWHLNYETIEPYALTEEVSGTPNFTVEKMKFPSKADKSKIIYNTHVTLTGIPLEAYEYIVNGKPALEWIIERYQVTKDKDSDITNNPNDWSDEPRYIIDLVKRIVRVSVETVKIVNGLPALNEFTE